ncbi:hypothetical protein KIPB_001063, partial [Kipferlia bialata]
HPALPPSPPSWLAPVNNEVTPSSTTVAPMQVVLAFIPLTAIRALFTRQEYDPVSWANVIACILIFGLLGIVLIARCSCCCGQKGKKIRKIVRKADTNKDEYVNVVRLRARFSPPSSPAVTNSTTTATATTTATTPAAPAGQAAETQKEEALSYTSLRNTQRGKVAGGLVTILLVILGVGMVGWTVFACIYRHNNTLVLPRELYDDMSPGQPPFLRERLVETVPYTSVDTVAGKYLESNVAANDNLYVMEALSGSSWDVQCIPSDPVFLSMTFEDKVRIVFSAGAGAIPFGDYPSLGVTQNPTTVAQLRAAKCLVLETEGCTLMGGPPCSATYSEDEDYTPLLPTLSYGCWKDETDMYHHVSAVSLAWAAGYPSFTDMTFTLSMVPTQGGEYDGFGLNTAAVRTHVYPGSFNQYLITHGESAAEPYLKGDTMVAGGLSVALGWWQDGMAYPRDSMDQADIAVAEAYVNGKIAANARSESDVAYYTDMVWNPFTEVLFDPDTGLQTNSTTPALWDSDRSIHSTVGPLPLATLAGLSPDRTRYSCSLKDIGSQHYFHGGLCEGLNHGDPLSGGSYTTQQPDAVLCGTQSFTVESQMMNVPGWCEHPESLAWLSSDGQEGYCESDRVFYSSVLSKIDSGFSVCDSTGGASYPLTISVRHKRSDQVTQVTFSNIDAANLIKDTVVLVVSIVGGQAALRWVLETLKDLGSARRKVKENEDKLDKVWPTHDAFAQAVQFGEIYGLVQHEVTTQLRTNALRSKQSQ